MPYLEDLTSILLEVLSCKDVAILTTGYLAFSGICKKTVLNESHIYDVDIFPNQNILLLNLNGHFSIYDNLKLVIYPLESYYYSNLVVIDNNTIMYCTYNSKNIMMWRYNFTKKIYSLPPYHHISKITKLENGDVVIAINIYKLIDEK